MKYAWFNNPVFRRAVSMAVDRDAMIRSVFFGEAVKNWSTIHAGLKLWYTPDMSRTTDLQPGRSEAAAREPRVEG